MFTQLLEKIIESNPMDVFKPYSRDDLGDEKYEEIQKKNRQIHFVNKLVQKIGDNQGLYDEAVKRISKLLAKKGFTRQFPFIALTSVIRKAFELEIPEEEITKIVDDVKKDAYHIGRTYYNKRKKIK